MYDNVENQLFFKCFQSHFLVILSPRDQESDRMSFWGKAKSVLEVDRSGTGSFSVTSLLCFDAGF